MKDQVMEISDGIAFYKRGKGPYIFLMPYPHASTYRPVAESRLADLLVKSGYTILSFDPPGSFRSTRNPELTINEIISCAMDCLEHFKISQAIPVLGHSMGSLLSIAFTIRHEEKVSRLILAGGTSGWKIIKKHGLHKSFHPLQKEFWLSRYYGLRIILGFNNLYNHKRLDNLNSSQSFFDKNYYEELAISPGDKNKPPPPRSKWLKMIRNYDLASELNLIDVPVLLITGAHDKITPPLMARELDTKIKNTNLYIFNNSGHSPFIEEPVLFLETLESFLKEK